MNVKVVDKNHKQWPAFLTQKLGVEQDNTEIIFLKRRVKIILFQLWAFNLSWVGALK